MHMYIWNEFLVAICSYPAPSRACKKPALILLLCWSRASVSRLSNSVVGVRATVRCQFPRMASATGQGAWPGQRLADCEPLACKVNM